MTTVQDIIYDARALLDEYTEEGIIISPAEVADIEAKLIRFISKGQRELYSIGRNFKEFSFTNKPITPVGGLFSGFDLKVCTGEGDIKYFPDEEGTDEGKSFYIEANETHLVELQEYEVGSWQTITPYNGVGLVGMTPYKANVTVTTPGNKVRLKLSSNTYFEYINTAFFPYKFVTVPDYRPWVHVTLPDDFRKLDSVVKEFPTRQHTEASDYKWEEPNIFIYNYYYEGSYKIIYKPIPAVITSKTDVLEIDDITAEALAFYSASWVAPFESQAMTNPLFQKFSELPKSIKV